jgi:hypothetical protein
MMIGETRVRIHLEPQTDADKELIAYLTDVRTLRERHRRPSTYQYVCVEDFLLKHGTLFTPCGLPAALRPMRMQQCFENAYRVARRTKAFHYVEGVALGLIPMDHAWVIDQDGNAYDPTWASTATGLASAYIGVELNLDEVQLSRRGGCSSLLTDWKRDFIALQGVDVFAKDRWFAR